jgi:arabinogalactan endo-1,4-beta-galactosidase
VTKPQKVMLAEIAGGADVNLIVQINQLSGNKREERRVAQTVLALLKQKMLQYARSGGLEISALGRETAAKQAAKAGAK